MSQKYYVAKGSLMGSTQTLSQGQVVPAKFQAELSDIEIAKLVKQGKLRPVPGQLANAPVPTNIDPLDEPGPSTDEALAEVDGASSPEQARAALEALANSQPEFVAQGKWNRDPADLESLNHQELLIQIMEIDPQFDLATITSAEQARELLSRDFNEAFKESVPDASADAVAEAARKAADDMSGASE